MNIGWPDTGACVSDRGRCYMLVKVGERGVSAVNVHRRYRALDMDMWVCGLCGLCCGWGCHKLCGNWILRRVSYAPGM